jgi:hypothetical protein
MNDEYIEELLKEMQSEANDLANDLKEKYLKKALEHLSKQTDKEEKAKTAWDLQVNDDYYAIDSIGDVYRQTWTDCDIDKCRRESGNVFLTQKDAEIEAEKRKIEVLLQKLGGVPFRKLSHKEANGGCVMTLDYDGIHDEYELFVDDIRNGAGAEDSVPFCFKFEMDAHDAIEKIGEKRLIAYATGKLFEND